MRSGAGNITVEYLGGISEGNIKGEFKFIVIPLSTLFMAPHSPFADRKCHQPFRQLIDRGY